MRNFMLIVGPISSLFDFFMFYILLAVLKADEALFQTGWFVESLCTQVLVIFVIRTRGNPLKSRAHPLLTATSLSVVGIAVLLPFTSAGRYFGMAPPPAEFYFMLIAMVLAYLIIAELTKQIFYRRFASSRKPRRTVSSGWMGWKNRHICCGQSGLGISQGGSCTSGYHLIRRRNR